VPLAPVIVNVAPLFLQTQPLEYTIGLPEPLSTAATLNCDP